MFGFMGYKRIICFFVKYLQISEIIPYFAKAMVIKFMPTI